MSLVGAVLAVSLLPGSAAGVRCSEPVGHRVVDCRLGKHGTPDLSRRGWRARDGSEVTISVRIRDLAGERWPLIDSLGRRLATLEFDSARGRSRS